MTVVLGTFWCFIKHIEAPYLFDLENGIAVHPMQGICGSSPAGGMSHGSTRVVAGTWGIFSSSSGDGHSNLHFVQRSENSCLVRMDTSGI